MRGRQLSLRKAVVLLAVRRQDEKPLHAGRGAEVVEVTSQLVDVDGVPFDLGLRQQIKMAMDPGIGHPSDPLLRNLISKGCELKLLIATNGLGEYPLNSIQAETL